MGAQRFIFKKTGETYELSFVRRVEGFGLPPVILSQKSRGWHKDGARVQYVKFEPRPFSVAFDMEGATYETVAAQHRNLMRFFADKTGRTLEYVRYDGRRLYLYPVYLATQSEPTLDEIPVISDTLQFIAENPYFMRDIPLVSATLETPLLEYPEAGLEIPEEGIEFSRAEAEMTISNEGDIVADTLVRFVGSAISPYVKNVTTGQRMEVNRTLGETDVLEINSATGKVEIIAADGTRSNAFNYVTDASEFITLARGTNTIQFGSSGGAGYLKIGGVEYYATAV